MCLYAYEYQCRGKLCPISAVFFLFLILKNNTLLTYAREGETFLYPSKFFQVV